MKKNYILIPITIWMLIACSKAGSTNVNPINPGITNNFTDSRKGISNHIIELYLDF
jgi:hypothetical protein